MIFEVCANSVQSAINAQKGGADRVELCANLEAGGTTPSAASILIAKEKLHIPIFVLIRPRAGDFVYSDLEFDLMKTSISFCKEQQIDGVVFGLLNRDNSIDILRNKILLELAQPMSCTFHRAFDRCKDPTIALEQIIEIGFDRILSSGQEESAIAGLGLLKKLIKQAENRIIIMPGAGINNHNIHKIIQKTGSKEIHFSAKKKVCASKEAVYQESNEALIKQYIRAANA